MKAFSHFPFQTGKIADLDRQFPSYLSAFDNSSLAVHDTTGTHFGYVHKGSAQIVYQGLWYQVYAGHYFCIPGDFMITGGVGIIVTRENYHGVFQVGGPVENVGRLRYIDGCSDSLLVPPVKLGDPCFNLLHFPEGIDQTEHTHPSDRIGMVIRGRGECVVDGGETIIPLEAGMIFCIHTDGLHKFRTLLGSEMAVLAYHPDSDFGPTDTVHPMINRTLVNGVSASKIPEIQTKQIR
jgi:mannose-6-phosphate isomerase-like protein (cupin superfamily)